MNVIKKDLAYLSLQLWGMYFCLTMLYLVQGCSFLISQHISGKRIILNYQCSLLDNVTCQTMSDLQILNSFEKLRSFCIQICKAFFSKPLFRGRKFDLKFCTFLHYPKRGHYAFQVILFRSNGLINYRKIEYF